RFLILVSTDIIAVPPTPVPSGARPGRPALTRIRNNRERQAPNSSHRSRSHAPARRRRRATAQGAGERKTAAAVVPAGGGRAQRRRAQYPPGPQPVGAVAAPGAAATGRAGDQPTRSAGRLLRPGQGTGHAHHCYPPRHLLRRPAMTPGLHIEPFHHTGTGTWSYLVHLDGDAVIIDPVLDYDPATDRVGTASADVLLARIAAAQLRLLRILETHAHADHLSAGAYLRAETG